VNISIKSLIKHKLVGEENQVCKIQ